MERKIWIPKQDAEAWDKMMEEYRKTPEYKERCLNHAIFIAALECGMKVKDSEGNVIIDKNSIQY